MNPSILGRGWITPLGRGLRPVWEKIQRDIRPTPDLRQESGIEYPCLAVNPEDWQDVERERRLRRASPVSLMMAAAVEDAMAEAGLESGTFDPERTALVAAVCSGSVRYTRKFYETIIGEGAASASPLLFPETVYNAPASHVAAVRGLTGPVYTVVGDASAAFQAVETACDLLGFGGVDQVVVAAAEEADPLIYEGYRSWRLLGARAGEPPFLADAGAALVLGNGSGDWKINTLASGRSFSSSSEFPPALRSALESLGIVDRPMVSAGGSGGRWDAVENRVLTDLFPEAPIFRAKTFLGESLGAGGLVQIIAGTLWTGHGLASAPPMGDLVVPGWGWNFQTAGLTLRRNLREHEGKSS